MGSPLYRPRPERWPQFRLRGLFVVVTLTALLMPWAVAEYRAWERRESMRALDDAIRRVLSRPYSPPSSLIDDLFQPPLPCTH
jgi:pilus assembly protein TadC